jgi:L-fuculose-phosphate aldolase
VSASASDKFEQVLAAAKEMSERGLVEGTAGNVSARLDDATVCITPSSVSYAAMTLDDLVVIDMDGNTVSGTRGPSSEKLLHTAIYQAYDDVGAVIHSHPIYATMFAIARQPVPACIDEFVMFIGGDVPVCDYGGSGTQELGNNAVAVLAGRSAALLANHGMVSTGANPAHALKNAALVERSAFIVWGARALGGHHEIPADVNAGFEKIYEFLRVHPM